MDKATFSQGMRDDPVSCMRMLRARISQQVEERHRLRMDVLESVAAAIEYLMHNNGSLAKFLARQFSDGGRKPRTAGEAVIRYLQEGSDDISEERCRDYGQATERRLLEYSPHAIAKQIVAVWGTTSILDDFSWVGELELHEMQLRLNAEAKANRPHRVANIEEDQDC